MFIKYCPLFYIAFLEICIKNHSNACNKKGMVNFSNVVDINYDKINIKDLLGNLMKRNSNKRNCA